MDQHNFFPRLHDDSPDRLALTVDDQDCRKMARGRPWEAVVTDQATGRRFRVEGASCSLPGCFCDAVLVCEEPRLLS